MSTTPSIGDTATALAAYISARAPVVVGIYTTDSTAKLSVEFKSGDKWQILLSDFGGAVTTNLVDPDGNAVKDLYESPEDAADYLLGVVNSAAVTS